MKSLHALLEEIRAKNPELFAKIEKEIQGHAEKMALNIHGDPKTEHPVKPPDQP